MKRKHLFMTMALAASFAACTSEDVIETSYTNEGARTVLDNIEFTIGEVDSRFTMEGGWNFDEGDAFGAALVDVTASIPSGSRAIDKYLLQNAIQSNYQYAYDNGVWTTPARLVEGNYVFYAPFNEKHLSRKPIEVITPIAQTLDVKDGVVDPYSTLNNAVAEGNPFFLAYEFLPAVGQETRLSLDFYSIFAYPKVTIKNNKSTDVTLTKVVINTGSEKFPVKAPLKVGSIDKVASNGVGGVVGNLFNVESDVKKQGAWFAKSEKTEDNGLVGSTTDVLGTVAASANVIVVDIPNDLEIPAGESVSFNVVMPAQKYTDVKVLAYINNDEGYEIELDDAMTFHPNKLYPTQEYKNDNSLNQSKKGSLFTATITKNQDTEELADAFPILVSTTAELKDAVLGGNSALYVIPTSEDVEINEDVFDAMRKVKFQGMTVAGDIKIVGSTSATTPLELNEDITVEGIATISGCVKTTEIVTLGEVNVTEDAVFNVAAATDKNASVKNIVNYGTTNIDDDKSATNVTNYGTLNVNAKGYAGTIKEGTTIDAEENVTYYGIVNMKAENTIANTKFYSEWNIKAYVTTSKDASIYGKMNVEAGKTLDGELLTIEGDATLNVDGNLYNKVELNGVLDADLSTAVLDTKYAKLYLNETSFLKSTFAAADAATQTAEENIVYVKKGAAFFTQTSPATDVTSWYLHTGNITKDAETYPTVPAVCNSVEITGNVVATEANADLAGKIDDSKVKHLIITGDVMANGAYTVTMDYDKLEVKGNVLMAGTSTLELTGVENLTVGGELALASGVTFNEALTRAKFNKISNDIALDLTGMTSLSINGKVAAKANIKADNVKLANAEILLSGNNLFQVVGSTVHIDGNTTLNGLGFYFENTTVKIYNGKTLTIAKGSIINDVTVNKVTFLPVNATSSTNSYTALEAATGVVVNNGTVKNAADWYAGATAAQTGSTAVAAKTWWSGTGTCTK